MRIEAAKRALAERAKRKATTAPDTDTRVVNLTADKAAHRVRARRRPRAQHDAEAPVPGAAELLPAHDYAIPLLTGPGSPGE
jgi:hypothetical protein